MAGSSQRSVTWEDLTPSSGLCRHPKRHGICSHRRDTPIHISRESFFKWPLWHYQRNSPVSFCLVVFLFLLLIFSSAVWSICLSRAFINTVIELMPQTFICFLSCSLYRHQFLRMFVRIHHLLQICSVRSECLGTALIWSSLGEAQVVGWGSGVSNDGLYRHWQSCLCPSYIGRRCSSQCYVNIKVVCQSLVSRKQLIAPTACVFEHLLFLHVRCVPQ